MFDRKTSSHPSRETLERTRISLRKRVVEWGDVLGIGEKHYRNYLNCKVSLPEKSWLALASWLKLDPNALARNQIDFRRLQVDVGDEDDFPERYSVAMFGRRRTTITSLDFVEQRTGWQSRADCLHSLGVTESLFDDPMAPISMQFITDLCAILSTRYNYSERDFHDMGVYSAAGNRNTVLAEIYGRSRSPSEVYELMFGEMLKFYEQNCTYSLAKLKDGSGLVTVRCNPHIADALRVRHLGNEHICQLKAGWMSSAMDYLGLPRALVRETACVHKGDPACKFVIDFEAAAAAHARSA